MSLTGPLTAQPVASETRLISASDIYTVQQASGAPTVALGGTVIPYKQVTLAAQIPGRVKFLAGIEGGRFDKDELLVAIDDTELLAKRSAAAAQYSSAQTQLRNAGVQYSRELWSPKSNQGPGGMGLPNLFDQMFTGKMEDFMGERDRDAERTADLFASSSQIEQARNALMRASAEIEAIDAKLRDARSQAPFSGVIMKKYVEVGDTVQPGQPLLEFADVTYLQIEVDVPSQLSRGLKRGMMLDAELDADGRIIPARVAQIFPMADVQRHTVKVKFDLPQGFSTPGMYVKVRVPDFKAPSRASPVIPKSSVRYNGSLPGAYVINERGEPQLRLIRVGEDLGSGYISVLSGLQSGERILLNPNSAITSGWASSGNKN
ncbi:MAG: efflux RND transporter periplasmic adaptor subunit [Gammaproteobacteria bacterium SHHR-1]|uniref:efflux RND transporter periplasmic adaptor subunit n=1 Tax=Magnetovirga frankeli TaxID=947516 RepID=UPI00326CC226